MDFADSRRGTKSTTVFTNRRAFMTSQHSEFLTVRHQLRLSPNIGNQASTQLLRFPNWADVPPWYSKALAQHASLKPRPLSKHISQAADLRGFSSHLHHLGRLPSKGTPEYLYPPLACTTGKKPPKDLQPQAETQNKLINPAKAVYSLAIT